MLKGIDIFLLAAVLLQEESPPVPDTEMDIIKTVLVVLCVVTILLIVYKVFIKGRDVMNPTPKWLLFIGFVILSPLAYLTHFAISFEESKPVSMCNSCHVMNGYVEDLKDPDSENIAALHYQYRWIADNQCFNCHTDYGLFGPVKAKMAGIRHVWKYYVAGYETPIELIGTYDNQICLHCHGPVQAYQDVEEHQDYMKDIETNKQSCFGADCHVSPHPEDAWKSANERGN